MTVYLGIDVGGTSSTVALANGQRQLIYLSPQFPTRSAEGPQVTVGELVRASLAALQAVSAVPADLRRVTLATPGPATIDGVLKPSPNLRRDLWADFPIRQALGDRFAQQGFDTPVDYIGDGQAAALGEFAVRSGVLDAAICPGLELDQVVDETVLPAIEGDRLQSLFLAAVGTGLGGGEVRDRQVVRGGRGFAGHVGHMLLPSHAFRYPHDRQLQVGNALETAESAISLSALTHQLTYRLGLPQWRDHSLNQFEGTAKEKAMQLRPLVAQTDSLALELLDDQAHALGICLLNVNYLGDYDLLVIGGGITEMAPAMRQRYLSNVKAAYRQNALDSFRDRDQIVFTVCGDNASVIGAVADACAAS